MQLRIMQDHAVNTLMAHPLIDSILNGSFTRAAYINYLADVHFYASHSSRVIALAGARLTGTSLELSDYLFSHAREELGHEAWAASDLNDLGVTAAGLGKLQISSPCLRMVGLEYLYASVDNPVGLFGWMFVLESMGGAVGGGIATAIDRTLALGGNALYFLKGHGVADAHHAEDLVNIIGTHLRNPADRASFERMYEESLDCYCEMLTCAQVPEQLAA